MDDVIEAQKERSNAKLLLLKRMTDARKERERLTGLRMER
jgi:hypothetical protein